MSLDELKAFIHLLIELISKLICGQTTAELVYVIYANSMRPKFRIHVTSFAMRNEAVFTRHFRAIL